MLGNFHLKYLIAKLVCLENWALNFFLVTLVLYLFNFFDFNKVVSELKSNWM